MKKKQALIVAVATTIIMIMTHWNIAYVTYVDKENSNNVACRIKWKIKGFDVEFYEAGVYDIKELHSKSVPARKKSPIPVNKKPFYQLDPNRFIIPVLEGGPNNQAFCLTETIFLAIKMNRTLVIPKFFKHFTDSQNKDITFVYPGHRISLEDVCSFVSCINLKQFQETCQEKIDAVMQLRSIGVKKMEQYMGMRVGKADGSLDYLEILPHSTEEHPYPRTSKVASTEIKLYFDSKARCLAYERPLFNLIIDTGKRLKPALVPLLDDENGKSTSDVTLMREITKKTQAPKYIGKLGGNFIKSLVGNRPLVTAHWRYNQGDYLQRCQVRVNRNRTKKSGQDIFCQSALHFTANDVANSIKEKLIHISQEFKRTQKRSLDIKDIYIASPPSERETVENISKILLRDMNWKVHNSMELENYITRMHGGCGFMSKHLNDVASTLEMEICAHGIVYLSSPRSTWSANVKLSRKYCTRSGTFPVLDTFIVT